MTVRNLDRTLAPRVHGDERAGQLRLRVRLHADYDAALRGRLDVFTEPLERQRKRVDERDLAGASEHGARALEHLVRRAELVDAVVGNGRRDPGERRRRARALLLEAPLEMAEELLGRVAELRAERDATVTWLRDRGLVVADSDANFCLFGRFDDGRRVWQGLLDRGVLIRETGPDGWLRVSIGTPEEMAAFKKALTEVLQA